MAERDEEGTHIIAMGSLYRDRPRLKSSTKCLVMAQRVSFDKVNCSSIAFRTSRLARDLVAVGVIVWDWSIRGQLGRPTSDVRVISLEKVMGFGHDGQILSSGKISDKIYDDDYIDTTTLTCQ
jgi:hypothetical protein